MQINFNYKKELRWLLPHEITINQDYRIYAPRERTDLINSIPESGIIEPLTSVEQDEKIILLNGHDRHSICIQKPDVKIPVWIITDSLSEEQKKKLILDLGRQKIKTKSDLAKEFELYDSIIPNNQGQRKGGHNRHKLIAGLMGISTSHLSQILRIKKQSPSLLTEVDNGHRTLSDAEQVAKRLKKENHQKEDEAAGANIKPPGKKIEMNPSIDVCPTCHRPFGDMNWKEIPELFTYKRDDTNNQQNWLEPLTDDDIIELNQEQGGADE